MAIKSYDELMGSLKEILKDNTSDEALAFIEDMNDTLAEKNDGEDWKARYEENDRQWREKYKARFFDGKKEDEVVVTEDEEVEKPLRYEDLFTVKED